MPLVEVLVYGYKVKLTGGSIGSLWGKKYNDIFLKKHRWTTVDARDPRSDRKIKHVPPHQLFN